MILFSVKSFFSKKFSVPQSSIAHALVLGEHGDSMVPIFSRVTVDGNSLLSMLNDDEKSSMIDDVRNYWKELRRFKSRSQFGIAKNTFDVISAIIGSKEITVPVSVVLDGEYGEKDVAMGVLAKINQNGVSEIEEIKMDEFESLLFKKSSQKIRHQLNSIKD